MTGRIQYHTMDSLKEKRKSVVMTKRIHYELKLQLTEREERILGHEQNDSIMIRILIH